MAELLTIQSLVILVTLTILELVLGVDNIIFLAIVSEGVEPEKRKLAQRIGLALALVGRIGMVLGISYLLHLEVALFSAAGHDFSAKDIVLLAGGLFLTYKSVTEIYKVTELKEGEEEHNKPKKGAGAFAAVIAQIIIVDLVFAVDSVLTAVGLTQQYIIIIIAMTIAVGAMMFFANPLSRFIEKHPSIKMLALAFLVLIGVLLLSESFGEEINRNYVYFAILFSLAVEALNFRRQANATKKSEDHAV